MTKQNTLSLSLKEVMPLIEEALAAGEEVTLTVKGGSMDPFLVDCRDRVVLTAVNGRALHEGDVVMFRRADGSCALHRIFRCHADGTYDIVGDNQAVCDERIPYEAIVAFVPRVIRKGKEIDCTKGMWRVAMVRYMHFRLNHTDFTWRMVRHAGA